MNTLADYRRDKLSKRTTFNIGFVLNQSGGDLAFEWTTHGADSETRSFTIGLPNNKEVKRLIMEVGPVAVADAMQLAAHPYGGMKTFLELWPNFIEVRHMVRLIYK